MRRASLGGGPRTAVRTSPGSVTLPETCSRCCSRTDTRYTEASPDRFVRGGIAHRGRTEPHVDMKLELVPVPVTDVDRAKAFYADRLGFVVDVDVQPAEGVRVVQLTPPGSACS